MESVVPSRPESDFAVADRLEAAPSSVSVSALQREDSVLSSCAMLWYILAEITPLPSS